MALSDVLAKIVGFLRAGYPEGVPDGDYIRLVALLRRRLSRRRGRRRRHRADFDGRRAGSRNGRQGGDHQADRRVALAGRQPSASSDAWLPSDGPSAIPSGRRLSIAPGHNAGDRSQGANAIALVLPMTRSCERAQAQLFADILRQEVAQMSKSIAKA